MFIVLKDKRQDVDHLAITSQLLEQVLLQRHLLMELRQLHYFFAVAADFIFARA